MRTPVTAESLDQIFRSAHTYNGWTQPPVEEAVVRDLYDLLRWGPTSANCCPARFVWVRSEQGKAKLAALAFEKNRPENLGGAFDRHRRQRPRIRRCVAEAYAAQHRRDAEGLRRARHA